MRKVRDGERERSKCGCETVKISLIPKWPGPGVICAQIVNDYMFRTSFGYVGEIALISFDTTRTEMTEREKNESNNGENKRWTAVRNRVYYQSPLRRVVNRLSFQVAHASFSSSFYFFLFSGHSTKQRLKVSY